MKKGLGGVDNGNLEEIQKRVKLKVGNMVVGVDKFSKL